MYLKKWFMLPLLFVGSLLVFYIISLQTYSINPDGILYLQTAHTMGLGSLKAAFSSYSWPFYSVMIWWFSQLTHLTVETSVTIMNALLQSLVTVFFWLLYQELDKRKVLLIIAAFTILLYPKMNTYRDYIIRDFGYWAFFLCGIWGMVRYAKQDKSVNIFIFYLGFILAFLFRIEGFCFLIAMPLACLAFIDYPISKRIKLSFKLYLPGIILAILVVAYFIIVKHEDIMFVGRMPQIGEAMFHGASQIINAFTAFSHGLVTKVLTTDAKNSAPFITLWGLSGLLIQKILTAPGIMFTALFIYAHYFKTFPITNNARAVLYFVILIYLGLTAYFIFTKYFLVDRYLLAMSFIILLWTPSALYDLYRRWGNHDGSIWSKSWMFPIVMLIIAIPTVGGIIKFGPSKAHIANSATWIQQHTKANQVICSNDKFFLFKVDGVEKNFEQDFFNDPYILLTQKKHGCDYLVAIVNRKRAEQFLQLQNQLHISPIKIFSNRHGDKVYIYERKS